MTDNELDLLLVLNNLVSYASQQICTHDETYRGGTNWEICHQCGSQWADDEGGKPPLSLPREIDAAYKIINKFNKMKNPEITQG